MHEVSTILIGSGWNAIARALRIRAEDPDATFLFVDPAPEAGGAVRTRRVEGHVCELGWQALRADRAQVLPFLEALGLLRSIVPAASAVPAELAAKFCGPAEAHGEPITLRSGLEEIVQAARRAFPGSLRLGRPLLAHDEHHVLLGGEVQHEVRAERVLTEPDRGAPEAASVWLGFHSPEAERALAEPGFVVAPGEHPGIHAVLVPTRLWPGRALPGRSLVRFLVDVHRTDLETLAAECEALLRLRTGLRAPVTLRRVFPPPR